MMTRYGMLIDTRKCIGCYACVVACRRQNDLLPDESFIHYVERERGTYPHVGVETVPMQCMHCGDAPCQAVCPTKATYTLEDGIVRVDPERCIGCKYCMAACPYQVRVQNHETGVIDKCRFCTVAALGGEEMCSCVEACLTGARLFGDLEDPESEISKAIVASNAQPIAADLTQSNVYYVR